MLQRICGFLSWDIKLLGGLIKTNGYIQRIWYGNLGTISAEIRQKHHHNAHCARVVRCSSSGPWNASAATKARFGSRSQHILSNYSLWPCFLSYRIPRRLLVQMMLALELVDLPLPSRWHCICNRLHYLWSVFFDILDDTKDLRKMACHDSRQLSVQTHKVPKHAAAGDQTAHRPPHFTFRHKYQ